MAADLLQALIGANLALGAAVLGVIVLRGVVRRLAGSRAAYALWLAAPMAFVAALLPARRAETLSFEPAPLRPLAEAVVAVVQPEPSLDLSAPLLALWAAGAGLGLALIAWRQARALRVLGPLALEGEGLLRSARSAIGPAVVGVLRPRIVLPADFEARFEPGERALILSHERAHLARKDAQINGLAALFRAVNWFNPLAHLAGPLLKADQEMACDEAVMRLRPGERRLYAQALLKTQISPLALPLGCQWPAGSTGSVKRRITRLTMKSPGRLRRALGGGLAVAAALSAGCAAWAVQPQAAVPLEIALPPARGAPAIDQAAPARPTVAPPKRPPSAARRVANGDLRTRMGRLEISADAVEHDRQRGTTIWRGNVRMASSTGAADGAAVFINGFPAPRNLRLDWLKPAEQVEIKPASDPGGMTVLSVTLRDAVALRDLAAPSTPPRVAPPRPAPEQALPAPAPLPPPPAEAPRPLAPRPIPGDFPYPEFPPERIDPALDPRPARAP